MKSGFTRTGKRTLGGLLDDGIKSVVRYYLNNFQDGNKQDALDLITGAFSYEPYRLPLQRQHSPVLPLLSAMVMVALGIGNAAGQRTTTSAFQALAGPSCYAALVLFLVIKNGKQLVSRPQLCPYLADTFQVRPNT